MKYSQRDWSEIQKYYDKPHTGKECCQHFKCGHTTWNKALNLGDIKTRKRTPKIKLPKKPRKYHYDWEAIQKYYDNGHSLREIKAHFGCGSTALALATKKGRLITRSLSDAMKNAIKLGKHTQNWSDESRQQMRENAIQNKLGGKRNSHTVEYKGVKLDSTYELRVAKVLDRDSIKWERPKNRFVWVDVLGQKHRYSPDFYLPEMKIYLDPKHKYLLKVHADKIKRVREQNNIIIHIFGIDVIEKWENNKFCLSIVG